MILSFIGNLFLLLITIFSGMNFASIFISKLKIKASFIYKITTLLAFCSILTLIYGFITNSAELELVIKNTHYLTPLIYKIIAIWGNHEGSMLLFLFLLCIAGQLFLTKATELSIKNHCFAIFSLGLFILFFANPFGLRQSHFSLFSGFNPALQDIGLAIHPPILYFGLSILCLSTVVTNENISIQKNIIRCSWALITLGISLGSWWAFHELGWGGFWFWDPVENISLIPWLVATIILHSQNHYSKLANLLKIFSASIVFLCFFLVRSGLITSIHSFAYDESTLITMFGLLLVNFLFAIHLCKLQKKQLNIKSQDLLEVQNFTLLAIIAIIFIASITPVIWLFFFKSEISISENFFNKTLLPIFIFIALLFNFYRANKYKLFFGIIFSLVSAFMIMFVHKQISLTTLFLVFVGSFVIYSSFFSSFGTLKKYSFIIAHSAFGALIICISLHFELGYSKDFSLKQGESEVFSEFNVKLEKISHFKEKNYLVRQAEIVIQQNSNNKIITIMWPQLRFYPVEKIYSQEVDIKTFKLVHNLYLSAGPIDASTQKLIINIQYKPYMNLIWFFLGVLSVSSLLHLSLAEKIQKFFGLK